MKHTPTEKGFVNFQSCGIVDKSGFGGLMRRDLLVIVIIILCVWAFYHFTVLSGNVSPAAWKGSRSHRIELLLEEASLTIARIAHSNSSSHHSNHDLNLLNDERAKLREEIQHLENIKRDVEAKLETGKNQQSSPADRHPAVARPHVGNEEKWLSIG